MMLLRVAMVSVVLGLSLPMAAMAQGNIDFGDDTSRSAYDGRCNDPRFTGSGTGTTTEADRMKDATDCRVAFRAGTIALGGNGPSPIRPTGNIDFGDDTSRWARDGECDDPRFTGPGADTTLVEADRLKDATDCRAAFLAGTISLRADGGSSTGLTNIDFGDDTSRWARDGECDDPRFSGRGADTTLLEVDRMKDATDCRAAFQAGTITYNPGGVSRRVNIDFGNDSSRWARDGECDDPRFTGAGMATTLLEADQMKDASDCRSAFEAGRIRLSTGGAAAARPASVVFGDDSSRWARDGECDDPRFTGTGMATTLLEADRMKDATDCRAAYQAGTIRLK